MCLQPGTSTPSVSLLVLRIFSFMSYKGRNTIFPLINFIVDANERSGPQHVVLPCVRMPPRKSTALSDSNFRAQLANV